MTADRTVLVLNPTRVDDPDGLEQRVARGCAARGRRPPLVLPTEKDDPGEGMARRAVAEGADLVLAAGGDGTVRSVACGLAGSGVPLGLLPLGTGNLLARNLQVPLELPAALEVALAGRDRALDLGCVTLADQPATCFVVMTGLGIDAEMMVDAPEHLKSAVGWPAYVVSGLKHLRDRGTPMTLVLDGRTYGPVRARGVVVGNIGRLQGGVALLPDARPDDGVLDVVVLAPAHLLGWVRVLGRLVRRSRTEDRSLQRYRARRVELHSAVPRQSEVDGEAVGPAGSMLVEVQPGALTVRVPRG